MRSLDADEERLWARVAATIRPLSREPVGSSAKGAAEPAKLSEAAGPKRRAVRQMLSQAPRPPKGEAHLPGTLDSSWDRRLRAGSVDPDRTIDLHGLSLDGAWNAIDTGLDRAIGAGERIVLLITGHARPGDLPVKRGKIRAAVHDWLGASRHSDSIAAVRGAHSRHGGRGSIYIILRRNRRKSTVP